MFGCTKSLGFFDLHWYVLMYFWTDPNKDLNMLTFAFLWKVHFEILFILIFNKSNAKFKVPVMASTLNWTSWKLNQAFYLFSDIKSLADYRAGFNQCANEVNRNILTSEGSDQLREKLLNHLASCCHGNATNRVATSHAPGIPAMTPSFPAVAPSAVWTPYPSPPPSPTNQSTVFIPVSPLKPEMHALPTLFSPTAVHVQKIALSPASSPTAATKTLLWRPWWTMNIVP